MNVATALAGPCLSCILPGGEELAPAGWADAAGDDPAGSGWPELQADGAALLAVGMVLVLRLGLAQLFPGEHWSGCGGKDRAGEPGDASDGSATGEPDRTVHEASRILLCIVTADRITRSGPIACLFCHQRLLLLRHVPQHDVVVRIGHARMTGIEIQAHVVNVPTRRGQIIERLLLRDVLQRDHVDRAYQLALMIVGQEGTGRQRAWVDIQRAKAGDEIGQFHQLAYLLVGTAGWRML